MNVLRLVALCAVWVSAFGHASAQAQMTGFNDASGINANVVAGSPYNANLASLNGQGAGEPGWNGNWFFSNTVAGSRVQSAVVQEGDLAMVTRGFPVLTNRLFPPNTQTLRMSMYVRSTGMTTDDAGFTVRLRDQNIGFTEGSVAVQFTMHPTGRFAVVSGTGGGGLTNFAWTRNVWHRIDVEANFLTKTWKFAVDNVLLNTGATPLGFRGTPNDIDCIELLTEVRSTDNVVYVDNLRFGEADLPVDPPLPPPPQNWVLSYPRPNSRWILTGDRFTLVGGTAVWTGIGPVLNNRRNATGPIVQPDGFARHGFATITGNQLNGVILQSAPFQQVIPVTGQRQP